MEGGCFQEEGLGAILEAMDKSGGFELRQNLVPRGSTLKGLNPCRGGKIFVSARGRSQNRKVRGEVVGKGLRQAKGGREDFKHWNGEGGRLGA